MYKYVACTNASKNPNIPSLPRELVATEILALIWSGATGGMIGLKMT